MEPARDQCSYYYTKEQIENLQIRITLQQLSGSQLVAVSPRLLEGEFGGGSGGGREVGGGVEEFPLASLSTSTSTDPHLIHPSTSHTQHTVIRWQQKLLSACEVVEYSRTLYAEDPLHKGRHEQAVKQKRKKKKKQQRIFTYNHHDNYQAQNWQKASTSRKMEPENWLRQRKNVAKSVDEGISMKHNDVTHTADRRKKGKQKAGQQDEVPDIQYFYIMADLAPSENIGESGVYEVVLCELRYSSQGQLTVSPNFTKPGDKPYRLESYGSDNALYEYKIENVSPSRSEEERQQENQLTRQLARQRIEEVKKMTASEWSESDLQGEGELRLVVMGEITRALHFDNADYLYVHYTLYLPSGWRNNSDSVCEGTTTACAVSYIDDIPTAHYCTPFTLDLTRLHSGSGWPVLMLGVFSIDWLGRDRDEGFASFTLTGQDNRCDDGVYSVQTWRPAQVSPTDKLRRFFLGGCQLITDPSYLALPVSSQVNRVSRLGFSTVSSGSVELRVNTMVQGDFIHTDLGVTLEHPSRWQPSTLAVIQAFNKSRQKLKEAKKGLQ